jgi:hypothetical protein
LCRALLLPILGERFIAPRVNFTLIIALYVMADAMAWMVWRDAGVAAFRVTVIALAVHATGERLGLLAGGTAWSYLGFVNLAYLACSVWAIYCHGADRPPADA